MFILLWAVFKLGVPRGRADREESQTEEITPSFNHLAPSHVRTGSQSETGIPLSAGCRQECLKQHRWKDTPLTGFKILNRPVSENRLTEESNVGGLAAQLFRNSKQAGAINLVSYERVADTQMEMKNNQTDKLLKPCRLRHLRSWSDWTRRGHSALSQIHVKAKKIYEWLLQLPFEGHTSSAVSTNFEYLFVGLAVLSQAVYPFEFVFLNADCMLVDVDRNVTFAD